MEAVDAPDCDVTYVQPLDHFRLLLQFEDGLRGIADLSDIVSRGKFFAPLQDPDYFAKVSVDEESGTVVWPNGADLAPEMLYRRARENPEGGGGMKRRPSPITPGGIAVGAIALGIFWRVLRGLARPGVPR